MYSPFTRATRIRSVTGLSVLHTQQTRAGTTRDDFLGVAFKFVVSVVPAKIVFLGKVCVVCGCAVGRFDVDFATR